MHAMVYEVDMFVHTSDTVFGNTTLQIQMPALFCHFPATASSYQLRFMELT